MWLRGICGMMLLAPGLLAAEDEQTEPVSAVDGIAVAAINSPQIADAVVALAKEDIQKEKGDAPAKPDKKSDARKAKRKPRKQDAETSPQKMKKGKDGASAKADGGRDGKKVSRKRSHARGYRGGRHGQAMYHRGRGGWDRHHGWARSRFGNLWARSDRGGNSRIGLRQGVHSGFGRMAMMRHVRSGGFGASQQGGHFGSRFAIMQPRWQFGFQRGRGDGPFTFRSSSDLERRLEALVTRMEAAAKSTGTARPAEADRANDRGGFGRFGGRPSEGFGSGGFRPFGSLAGARDQSAGRGPQRERGESRGEEPSLDQMRQQLRRLAEQQEQMMRAIRELSQALEKSAQK